MKVRYKRVIRKREGPCFFRSVDFLIRRLHAPTFPRPMQALLRKGR